MKIPKDIASYFRESWKFKHIESEAIDCGDWPVAYKLVEYAVYEKVLHSGKILKKRVKL